MNLLLIVASVLMLIQMVIDHPYDQTEDFEIY